jgi:oligopeptide/dipeptide ABC transporter ATP-binding protein
LERLAKGDVLTAVSSPDRTDACDSASTPLLRVDELRVAFTSPHGPIPAVRGVGFDVGRGETLALLGESGSGKSVTARSIMGLAGPSATVTATELRFDGIDLRSASAPQLRALRGDQIGMVFQDALSALNPVLTVQAQIAELFRIHRGLRPRQARGAVHELLAAVGIPDPARRARDYPHQFSGGMRQRIVIAMAIALEPRLLIADEPTTALDVTVQAQILDLLCRLRDELGLAVILITHDLGVACEVADRVAVMYHGRIVETGPTADVLRRPAHPYTAALLRSVPRGGGGADLHVIAGSPPPPTAQLPGCSFAPRCTWAIDRCTHERPVLAPAGTARQAACHRIAEVLDA